MKALVILCWMLFAVSSNVLAKNDIRYQPTIYFTADDLGKLNINDIVERLNAIEWTELKSSNFLFEPNKTYWFKFQLPSNISSNSALYIGQRNFGFESQNFYRFQVFVINDQPYELTNEKALKRFIPIDKQFEGDSIYLKYDSFKYPGITQGIQPQIANIDLLHDNISNRDRFLFGVYGAISIMLLYNIGNFILFRNVYFFYYIIYVSSFLLWAVAIEDYLSIGKHYLLFLNLCLIFAGMGLVLFSTTILSTTRRFPILTWVGYGILLFGTLTYSGLSLGILSLLPLAWFWPVATNLFCVIIAIKSAYLGYKPAFPMVLGWGIILVTAVIVWINLLFPFWEFTYSLVGIAIVLEISLFSFSIAQKSRFSELKALKQNQHAFDQMSKIVYPHQIAQIKANIPLEQTMPVNHAEAAVISFDIIGSSKIVHVRAKDFFRNVFRRCNEIMIENYDPDTLTANAFRIKEMGDGFLCSVGYPFESPTENIANDAIELAYRFKAILDEEAKILESSDPVCCGIGIAIDTLQGFYPEGGTKEYDIYGRALILATRYEGLRKAILESGKPQSIMICQERVIISASQFLRERFQKIDLRQKGIVVRDDPAATTAYIQYFDQGTIHQPSKQDSSLKVVS